MKSIIMVIGLLVVSNGIAQSKSEQKKVTRALVKTASFYSELVKVPDGCSVIAYEIACKRDGKPMVLKEDGGAITKDGRELLLNVDKGTRIYFDAKLNCIDKSTNLSKNHTMTAGFIIED